MSKSVGEITCDIMVAVLNNIKVVDLNVVGNFYETIYKRVQKCETMSAEEING